MSRSSSRRRHWTKRFTNRLGLIFGPTLFRLLSMSWRVSTVNLEVRDAQHKDGAAPVIAFWHGQIPAAIGTHRDYSVRVLISLNRDGEMIANLARRLGYKTVRGSSSRRSAEALRELLEAAKGPEALGLTPDGPRGPIHSVAPGVIYVAAASRRALLTTGFASSSAWHANSWDRMVLPKPFARVVIAYDDSVGIPDEAAMQEGESQEAVRQAIKDSIAIAESRAADALNIL